MQPELERYLQALVEETERVLGEDLVGVYATGSIALGAFQVGAATSTSRWCAGPSWLTP